MRTLEVVAVQLAGPDSRPDSRGPGTVISATPAVITRPAMFQCQRSAAHSSAPSPASSAIAIGTRRLTGHSRVSGRPVSLGPGRRRRDASRRWPVQACGGHGRSVRGEPTGPHRGQMSSEACRAAARRAASRRAAV